MPTTPAFPDPKEILRSIIDRALLVRVGEQTLAIIKERTLRGEFLEGSTSQGYSTKPAPMPLGGFFARLGKGRGAQAWRRIQKGDESGSIWRESKSKKIWITLQGGYKRLRELAGKETDRVTLNWRGHMLRSLNRIRVNAEEMSVTIGFADDEAGTLAGFHHAGAGRSQVKRLFMGLSGKELEEIVADLGANR